MLGMGCELGLGYLVSPPVPADIRPSLAAAAPAANVA
jgi:EAL domain-containing protein (putative c-di-GMP-specific phosphodiesterase class I)